MLQRSLLVLSATVSALLPPAVAKPVRCRDVVDIQCPIVFDGRVPADAELTDFNTGNGGGWNPFNPGYVKGDTLEWSDILLLPDVEPPSRFDWDEGTVALEVTISDESIFMNQNGFRRAGLQFNRDRNNNSPANIGLKTLHFSIQLDPQRPLNLSHEYLNVWHETAAYDANQFNFQIGSILGQASLPENHWKLFDRNMNLLWSTPVSSDGAWQNFALTLDYDQNTVLVWYSDGDEALEIQGEALSVNLAGNGQYQIGILKKPTGTSDVVNSGYQSPDLDEGLIYGGLFIEDSTGDCVST